MDPFEESLQENIGFEGDKDSSTFEEFLDPEEYIDLGHLFTTDRIFSSKDEARTFDRRPYVTLACERGGLVRKYKKSLVDDEEEEIPKKNYSHAQSARLTEEQWQQTELFRKSHVPPRNILRFFREQDRRNTVEEVLRLSAERGYTVFYRNGEDSNVLSDIVVAHPTLIAMLRRWPYVLIMDTTYKTNNQFIIIKFIAYFLKYNMPLVECVGMTPTGKNFTVATTFMCNEQATTYR
ncbi:hypothetical protein M9H77_03520 [Catharanthus roseus]|uniref:Uncharacterized protein n=1 Tax=Catharanthus roseus TaxID=4058 RepID=A0ACC0CBN4_CATRO|nr:hypothetical protein M9H77_03520 [Catharanthus roseus]